MRSVSARVHGWIVRNPRLVATLSVTLLMLVLAADPVAAIESGDGIDTAGAGSGSSGPADPDGGD